MESSTAASGAVGRAAELSSIDRFLEAARDGFAALSIEGEAGIGKTTLFHEALHRAEDVGFLVLAAGPAASEARLSLSGLSDLLRDVPADAWAVLPNPQREAVEVALLLRDAGDQAVDVRAISAGVRSLIATLAEERPVLIAIDDVQWLDAASAEIVGYVARRLRSERVGLIVSRRIPAAAPLALHALAADVVMRTRVGPLSRDDLQRLLLERLGVSFPRSVQIRIHETSAGNPFFALEIARILLEREATPSAGEPLPVPEDVRELVAERVAGLPHETRELLLAAALLARPALDALEAVFGRSALPALDPAERAGVASVHQGVVAFVHPLHGAAVVASVTTADRRAMHRRLAAVAPQLEERALHLALATDRPDDAVATSIEEGAAAATRKGGLHAAAALLERARALTPPADARRARLRGVRAAELYLHAGDRHQSTVLLQDLLGEPLDRDFRTDALRLLGELHAIEEDFTGAQEVLSKALGSADDPPRVARIHLDLAWVATQLLDFDRAARHAREAWGALAGYDDPDGSLLAEALAYSAMTEYLAGGPIDWERLDQALVLEDPTQFSLIGLPPGGVVAAVQMYAGRHDQARRLMSTVRDHLTNRGDERDLAHALLWSSWLETRSGRFSEATSYANAMLSTATLAGNRLMESLAIGQRAWVDAHVGRIAEARRAAAAVARSSRGPSQVDLWIAATLALAAMSEGDPTAAWAACQPLVEVVERVGLREPVPLMFLPDAIEALIALHEVDRADRLTTALEAHVDADGSWAALTSGRVRGVLLAERGDLEAAIDHFEAALGHPAQADFPFERARTALARGIVERRARHRATARQTLQEAAAEFERLGAELWAGRSRTELTRASGGERHPSDALTPGERRVAELAAGGIANKAIAGELSITVHTVEAHLSRVYTKLGISSRTQLANLLRSRDSRA